MGRSYNVVGVVYYLLNLTKLEFINVYSINQVGFSLKMFSVIFISGLISTALRSKSNLDSGHAGRVWEMAQSYHGVVR